MKKFLSIFSLTCVLAASWLNLPQSARGQYGGPYRGSSGTRYYKPSRATNSLILQHSINRAQIKRKYKSTSKRRSKVTKSRRYRWGHN